MNWPRPKLSEAADSVWLWTARTLSFGSRFRDRDW